VSDQRSLWILPFVMLSIVMASGQPGSDACSSVEGRSGPFRCPNGSACGTYYTLQTEGCNVDNECDSLVAFTVCCGKYPNYTNNGLCGIAEMKDPRIRSRILDLAKNNEILVPTCSGAYVPARIAFREHRGKDNRGL